MAAVDSKAGQQTSAPASQVDVLAVLDRQIAHTRQFGGSPSFQTMLEARAAVAELINACRKATCQCQRAALGLHQYDCHLGDIPAALDRVGGAK